MKKILLFLVVSLLTLFFSSCANSRASIRVRNNAESTSTTIDVTTGDGGTTTVNVSPKISADSTIVNIK